MATDFASGSGEALPTKDDGKFTTVTSDHGSVIVGEVQLLTRKFSFISMMSLAFTILGTWSTMGQNLSTGLSNGGPITILYGLVFVTICNVCVALSIGELCSSMPTALGQAYWVHRLWPTPAGRFLSYLCAWINTFGWWTLTASQVGFMTSFMLAMKVSVDNDWDGASKGWVQLLVYFGIAFVFTAVNVVGCRRDKFLPWFNNWVAVSFFGLFLVFSMAMLIGVGTKPGLKFQPASFAMGQWLNSSGWPDAIAWFLGLVQAAYGLTAFDSVVHMVEELPSPRTIAPKVIWLSVVVGAISAFVFVLVCMFCIQDIDTTLNSPTGVPLIQILTDATGVVGAVTLTAMFEVSGLGQGVSIATTASRLTWGFARDGGLPWHRYFAQISPYWKAPVRATWLQGFLVALVGVLYTFSSTVLTAILAVSTIALTISYGIPILVLMLVGRDKLPPGEFSLGRYGPVLNWISVIYCSVSSVFFFFPSNPNPAVGDMNWAIAVFGVMMVIAVVFWFVQGQASYLNTEDAEERLLRARYLEDDSVEPTLVDTAKRV